MMARTKKEKEKEIAFAMFRHLLHDIPLDADIYERVIKAFCDAIKY